MLFFQLCINISKAPKFSFRPREREGEMEGEREGKREVSECGGHFRKAVWKAAPAYCHYEFCAFDII